MSEAPVADLSSLDTGHGADGRVVYKVVLTGGTAKNIDHDGSVAAKILSLICSSPGPCAGKTTTVARLRTFFENLGWKVTAHCVSSG